MAHNLDLVGLCVGYYLRLVGHDSVVVELDLELVGDLGLIGT